MGAERDYSRPHRAVHTAQTTTFRPKESALSEILTAALRYAENGWPVFPVGRDKRPLTKHGQHDATCDADQIQAWWAGHPEANVAFAIPPGLVVIDIDPRNGGSLDAYDFPRTRTATTPGGGWHLYYRVAEDVRLRGKLGTGIDVKRRGYVLLAPSVNADGAAYEWTGTPLIAPLPDELLSVLDRDAEGPAPTDDFTFESRYGQTALESEIGRLLTAPEGERNDSLNKAAFAMGQLIAADVLREEIVVERLTLAAERIGLEPEEIELTHRSGLEAGQLEPREIQKRDAAPAFEFDDEDDEPFWLDWQADDEEVAWLMHPYLPAEAFVLIFGPTQASKSMVARWMAATLSNEGRRVSYYSLENPANVDRRDLKRLGPSTDPEHFRISNRLLDLADPQQVEAMVARERGRDLIILDTYVHAFSPRGMDGDENAMAVAFARVVRRIIKRTGATVVVIDHTGFERRDEPRGASAKRQQVDVAITMESSPWLGPGHDAQFTMRNVKSARFANPFTVTGVIRDTADGNLAIRISGIEDLPREESADFQARRMRARALLAEEDL